MFDVLVVGGGHAGIEAAHAAARLGRKTALISFTRDQIGRLSCNPAMGGLAKGCLVREIDALGGLQARASDLATIQFRRLNTRKGLAVQASRAQLDTALYPHHVQALLQHPNLEIIAGEAAQLLLQGGRVVGLVLADGTSLAATAVILTTGTFLGGLLHCGQDQRAGGRIGERAAYALSTCLKDLGIPMLRLKTGTPPRLRAGSIRWDILEKQPDETGQFSFGPRTVRPGRRDMYITYTNAQTHEIIRDALPSSPMYSGQIEGRGPRYCPSIEDKIVRFGDKERHQLFLEPEGLTTERVYINGTSTSLPPEVQTKLIHSVVGLERAEILQYGYAVEYDAIDATFLGHDLQIKHIPGLFCAGQINGTSGYEEAAAQGLMAGIHAAGRTLTLTRSEAYIGVMVDDLVTRGVGGEPYRMFPSRAEHRLWLREDNADRRLMPKAQEHGLLVGDVYARFCEKEGQIRDFASALDQKLLVPDAATLLNLERAGLGTLKKPVTAREFLRRPEVGVAPVQALLGLDFPEEVAEQVEIDTKYEGYLAREESRMRVASRLESVVIAGVDFRSIASLSMECRERLARAQPSTLGAAARLPGITPAAIDALALAIASQKPGGVDV